jgi:RNA polymerase sigma-70 factor (ECF subfamily)
MGMDPSSDLVRRCADGDPLAFDCLVREYMNTVLGLAYNYVGNFHTAEDLAQETFVQAFQSISSLRDGNRFKVWLLRIARNKCIDYIRRNPRWLSIDQDQDLHKEVALKTKVDPALDRDDRADFSEADLLTALNSLRQDYREIFIMKHVDNLSYREIADLLGMTVSAVGEKLYRVRSMIRERLIETRPGSSAS